MARRKLIKYATNHSPWRGSWRADACKGLGRKLKQVGVFLLLAVALSSGAGAWTMWEDLFSFRWEGVSDCSFFCHRRLAGVIRIIVPCYFYMFQATHE